MNDYSMTKDLVENAPNANSISLILLILISVNIGVEIFRFISMLMISNKERNNKRKLLIEEKRIKIIEQLFQSLDKLTLYDNSEEHEMLKRIKEINLFMTQNKLYIPKKFQDYSNEILDYFKNVLTDYRQKSIEKELKLFDKFCHEFDK